MNSLKSFKGAVVCVIAVVTVILMAGLVVKGDWPSKSQIRRVMETKMNARIKGCTVTSISLIRGEKFPSQSHQGKIALGTPIYPIRVTAVYTALQHDGSRSEAKEMTRMLYLYKLPSDEWANDDDLR